MQHQHTNNLVADVVVDGLTSFHRDEQPRLDRFSLPQDLSDTALEQDAIGWRNFTDGFVAKGWSTVMQARFLAGGRRMTGRRWEVGLLRQVWQLSRDIWQHRNELPHGGNDLLSRQALYELNRKVLDSFGGLVRACLLVSLVTFAMAASIVCWLNRSLPNVRGCMGL